MDLDRGPEAESGGVSVGAGAGVTQRPAQEPEAGSAGSRADGARAKVCARGPRRPQDPTACPDTQVGGMWLCPRRWLLLRANFSERVEESWVYPFWVSVVGRGLKKTPPTPPPPSGHLRGIQALSCDTLGLIGINGISFS